MLGRFYNQNPSRTGTAGQPCTALHRRVAVRLGAVREGPRSLSSELGIGKSGD